MIDIEENDKDVDQEEIEYQLANQPSLFKNPTDNKKKCAYTNVSYPGGKPTEKNFVPELVDMRHMRTIQKEVVEFMVT